MLDTHGSLPVTLASEGEDRESLEEAGWVDCVSELWGLMRDPASKRTWWDSDGGRFLWSALSSPLTSVNIHV